MRKGLGEADFARLGGRIVHLAELSLLAVDRGDIDDAAELSFAHALDHVAAHVEQRAEIGIDNRRPLLELHAVQLGIARDAGIVDQHVDRSELGLDLLDAGGAGIEGRDVPLVDVDAGFGLEALCRLVIAGVIGGDRISGRFERLTNGGANAARTPSDQRNAGHDVLPDPVSFRRVVGPASTSHCGNSLRT